MLLHIRNLSKSYGAENIFSGLSFMLRKKEKIGIVGRNGSGKTTFMRIIAGEEPADNGEISFYGEPEIGYLRQVPSLAENLTLEEFAGSHVAYLFEMQKEFHRLSDEMALFSGADLEKHYEKYNEFSRRFEEAGGFDFEARLKKIIRGLGFSPEDFSRKISDFSGGEKTRAAFAGLLLQEPDILLLDEPTNHLDIESIQWLENYLSVYPKSVVMISHDRYFLDRTVSRIYDMDYGLEEYKGNYSDYLAEKETRLSSRLKAYGKQQDYIRKEMEFIRRYKAGVKSKQARGREKKLERLERLETPAGAGKAASFRLKDFRESGNVVVRGEKLGLVYEGRSLFGNVDFEIRKGKFIALIGRNGSGKSSILRILTGHEKDFTGSFSIGSRVTPGYFEQEHRDLNPENTVYREILENFDLKKEEIISALASVLFFGDDLDKKVRVLSGGEKSRLAFLKLMLSSPNFLLLDEPTNHLDLPSREAVEDFLTGYPGTVIAVTHDRYFMEKLGAEVWELGPDGIYRCGGGYSYYLEKKALFREEQREKKEAVRREKTVRRGPSPRRLKEEIAAVEEEIRKLEIKKNEMEEAFAAFTGDGSGKSYAEMQTEYGFLEDRLEELLADWEKKNVMLEEAEG